MVNHMVEPYPKTMVQPWFNHCRVCRPYFFGRIVFDRFSLPAIRNTEDVASRHSEQTNKRQWVT